MRWGACAFPGGRDVGRAVGGLVGVEEDRDGDGGQDRDEQAAQDLDLLQDRLVGEKGGKRHRFAIVMAAGDGAMPSETVICSSRRIFPAQTDVRQFETKRHANPPLSI